MNPMESDQELHKQLKTGYHVKSVTPQINWIFPANSTFFLMDARGGDLEKYLGGSKMFHVGNFDIF